MYHKDTGNTNIEHTGTITENVGTQLWKFENIGKHRNLLDSNSGVT